MQKPITVKPITRETGRLLPGCFTCGGYATTEAHFEAGSCIVLHRYCEDCIQTAEYDDDAS
jgi:hypothetical protein